jgi:hypothetical protein
MKLFHRIVFGALLAAAGLFLGGCGYHSGFLIPADVNTIHVRVVGNDTFWHEAVKVDNLPGSGQPSSSRPAYTMELDLTERLKNEVVRRTPLRIAPEDRADSILEATIRRVEPSVLARDVNDDYASVGLVTISADFTWRDRRTGRIHAEGKNIARPTTYTVARGETFASATRTSFDYIAERIVEQMQENF